MIVPFKKQREHSNEVFLFRREYYKICQIKMKKKCLLASSAMHQLQKYLTEQAGALQITFFILIEKVFFLLFSRLR